MMTPLELFQAGKLSDALQKLTVEVRNEPADVKRRSFLFELLCFAGEHERARKHLDVLGQLNPNASVGAVLCLSALHAEGLRQDLFQNKAYPADSAQASPALTGSINGKPFQQFLDADPRVGGRLEVFAAGNYLWIPFDHIDRVELEPPRRLRDLLWAPAMVRTGPAFHMRELGEVFLPVLSPFSWKHTDESVRLGRTTVWETDDTGDAIPFGQKMFVVDDEELPLLELRTLQFTPSGATA